MYKRQPLSLHEQVITLCAATHKLFLDVPVKELKKFQKEMLAWIDQKHPQIGEEIEELHSLSDTPVSYTHLFRGSADTYGRKTKGTEYFCREGLR